MRRRASAGATRRTRRTATIEPRLAVGAAIGGALAEPIAVVTAHVAPPSGPGRVLMRRATLAGLASPGSLGRARGSAASSKAAPRAARARAGSAWVWPVREESMPRFNPGCPCTRTAPPLLPRARLLRRDAPARSEMQQLGPSASKKARWAACVLTWARPSCASSASALATAPVVAMGRPWKVCQSALIVIAACQAESGKRHTRAGGCNGAARRAMQEGGAALGMGAGETRLDSRLGCHWRWPERAGFVRRAGAPPGARRRPV